MLSNFDTPSYPARYILCKSQDLAQLISILETLDFHSPLQLTYWDTLRVGPESAPSTPKHGVNTVKDSVNSDQ